MVSELLQPLAFEGRDMIQTVLSWAVCAVTLVVLLFVLYKRERGGSSWLLVAVLFSCTLLEAFDNIAVSFPSNFLFWKRFSILLESLLPMLFLSFSMAYARNFSWSSLPIVPKLLLTSSPFIFLASLAIPIGKIFYTPDFSSERMLFLSNAGFALYIAIFVYLVAALYNLEATYRSAERSDQWQIKFTLMGVGSLLALYVFYYSQGLLYRSINMNLAPLRTLALLVAVVLTTYSLVRGKRRVRVVISKDMAFRSAILVIVGTYLILLGLLGEGLRYFGEASQQVVFFSVFFLGCVLLVALLLSEQMKRKVKVLINKNFFENKYDYRNHWLEFTGRLANVRNMRDLDAAILSMYCETFAMGGALLYVWSPEQAHFYNRTCYQGEPSRVTFSRDNPLVRYMSERQWVFNAEYFEPDVAEINRCFLEVGRVAFAVPIFSGSELEGFIALLRPINSGETYSYEDYDLMKTLASQAAFALTSARLSEQLAVAREMEAVGRVTAFVMHDLKNLAYSLSLLSANAADFIRDPEFQQDLLVSLSNTVSKMKGLISKLKEVPDRHKLSMSRGNLLELANDTVASLKSGGITVHGSQVIAEVDIQEMDKVLTNLVINALDATDGAGPVSVVVGGEEQAFIRVADRGCGMTPEFIRDELFAPFKSTKKKGLGIGLFQSRQIVEAHQGRIEVESEPGKGSVFTVWLPLGSNESADPEQGIY